MDSVANGLAFVAYCAARLRERRDELASQVRTAEHDLAQARATLTDAHERRKAQFAIVRAVTNASLSKMQTNVTRAEGALRTMRGRLDRLPAEGDFRGQYERILDIPRVRAVTVRGTRCRIETEMLYGKDKSGSWHRVGRYVIAYDARFPLCREKAPLYTRFQWQRDGGPIFTGQTAVMTSFGAGPDGERNCLGTALEPLVQSLEALDYPTLVALLVRFPECPGQSDLMRFWPTARREEVPSWYIRTFGS